MSQRQKITPYVPHTPSVKTFHNHKVCLRKGPSKIVQLKLAETVRFYNFTSSTESPYPVKLLKLLKNIKGFKRLRFDQNILNKCGFTKATMIAFRKKTRRTQELTINEFWTPALSFRTKLNIWIKCIKNLQKMTFNLEIFQKDVYQKKSFSKQIKSFLKSLKHQNQMKSLKLQLPQEVSFANPTFVEFSKYPESLQNLQLFYCTKNLGAEQSKLSCFPLSHLKKLEAFALRITDDHEIVRNLIDTLPSLSHLKSLGLILPTSFVIPKPNPLYGPHCYHLDSQVFSNLKSLNLTIQTEFLQTPLIESLNLSNLQSLQLSFRPMISSEYKETFSNLSKIKQLKTLKLDITYLIHLEELTKYLFESLVGLELLTSLKIFLVTSDMNRYKDDISSDTLPALNRTFQKPIKIEEFSLECKELVLSHEFFGLMEIFCNAPGENFKKFKIDTFPFVLDEKKTEALAGFIGGLKNVRVLKLPCFDIDSNELLTRLTSKLVTLKDLRSICLGKMGWKVSEKNFIGSLENILEKRGLQILKCEFTDDFKKRIEVVGSPLSFEQISKKNPFLKFVGETLWGVFQENK